MHGTGGRKVVVFDRFQRYIETVRKLKKECYNSLIFQFNDKAQVRCKAIEKALHGFKFLSDIGNLLGFLAKKNESKSLSFHHFGSNMMTSL